MMARLKVADNELRDASRVFTALAVVPRVLIIASAAPR